MIALTANAMEGDREKCIAAGMDDYISKPVTMQSLYSALDRYIGLDKPVQTQKEARLSAEAEMQSQLQCDNLEQVIERLIDEACFRRDDAQKLITGYFYKLTDVLSRIRTYLQNGNMSKAAEEVYNLKGSSGNLRLKNLHHAVIQLGEAILEKDVGKSLVHLQRIDAYLKDIQGLLKDNR